MMIRKLWRSVGKYDGRYDGVRTMVGKASNRAGVHGSKLPNAKALDNEEEIKERISKGSQDKEEKRRERLRKKLKDLTATMHPPTGDDGL